MSNTAPNGKKNRTGLIVGIAVALGVVCFLAVFAVYYFVLRRKKPYENQDEGKAKGYVVFLLLVLLLLNWVSEPTLTFFASTFPCFPWCWCIDARYLQVLFHVFTGVDV